MLETDINTEVWLPVVGHEGVYEVSNKSRVRSVDRFIHDTGKTGTPRKRFRKGVLLKELINHRGRAKVCLWKNKKKYFRFVYRLSMEAFVGKSPLTVDHLDEDITNNCITNLEYVSLQENRRRQAENIRERKINEVHDTRRRNRKS